MNTVTHTLTVLLCLVAAVLADGAGSDPWTNWNGRQTCHPGQTVAPRSVKEVADTVRAAATQGLSVKAHGSGHSFSPAALVPNGGVLVSLEHLNALVKVEGEHVTVQAGMQLKVLNEKLWALGLALPNVGSIGEQTVAGATSTGTHGTGVKLGSTSSQITALKIADGRGDIVLASAEMNADIFHAARVGVGALGIVVEVTLACVPAFNIEQRSIPYNRTDLLASLPALHGKHERFQYFWVPYTEDAGVQIFTPTDAPITGCWPDSTARPNPRLPGGAGAASNDPSPGLGKAGKDRESSLRLAGTAEDGESSCVDASYKALSSILTSDTPIYTEMEMFVPLEYEHAFVTDFIAFQDSVRAQHQDDVHLFTGVRHVAADDIALSQMQGRDSVVISMQVQGKSGDAQAGREFDLYARGLEEVAGRYGGRPHWGKMNFATADDIRRVYPDTFAAFEGVRRRMDPHGMFVNEYLGRLLGATGSGHDQAEVLL